MILCNWDIHILLYFGLSFFFFLIVLQWMGYIHDKGVPFNTKTNWRGFLYFLMWNELMLRDLARIFWRHLSHEMFRLPLVPRTFNVKLINFQPKNSPKNHPTTLHQPQKTSIFIKNPSSKIQPYPAPSHPKPPIPRRWSRLDVAPAVRPHPAARSQPGPRQPREDLQAPAVGPAVVAYSSGGWEKRGKNVGKSWKIMGKSWKFTENPILGGKTHFLGGDVFLEMVFGCFWIGLKVPWWFLMLMRENSENGGLIHAWLIM